MKKVFTICTAAAASLLFAACGESNSAGQDFGLGPYGTMSVDGIAYELRSGYVMLPDEFENNIYFMFCPDSYGSYDYDPDAAIEISLDPALLGVTIDLAQPRPAQGIIHIIAYDTHAFADISLGNRSACIETPNGQRLKITEGSLFVDRSGNRAELRFQVQIEDGTEVSGSWNGPAKEVMHQYAP